MASLIANPSDVRWRTRTLDDVSDMGDDFSKAKNSILSSGLPLEYAVERTLRALKFVEIMTEVPYERTTARTERDFSIDLTGARTVWGDSYESRTYDEDGGCEAWNPEITWRIFIECKYVRREVQWLFLPYKAPTPSSGSGVKACNIEHRGHLALEAQPGRPLFDQPVSYKVPHETCFEHADHGKQWTAIPVTRGIELRHSKDKVDDIPRPIREAVSQLQFGWLPLVWPHVMKALNPSRRSLEREPYEFREPRETTIFTQFIVTTAPLLVARPDLSIADVEQAETLSVITAPADVVEVMTGTSEELLRHQRNVVASYRDWARTDPLDDSERAALNKWAEYASRLQRSTPSIFIVRYEALQMHLENQIQSLASMAADVAAKVAEANDLVHPWDERMGR